MFGHYNKPGTFSLGNKGVLNKNIWIVEQGIPDVHLKRIKIPLLGTLFSFHSRHRFNGLVWDKKYGKEVTFDDYDEIYRSLLGCSCGMKAISSWAYSWL